MFRRIRDMLKKLMVSSRTEDEAGDEVTLDCGMMDPCYESFVPGFCDLEAEDRECFGHSLLGRPYSYMAC